MITSRQLTNIMPLAVSKAGAFLLQLNAAMDEFDIVTPEREAAFLAQIAHESGQLRYLREIASGAAYEGRVDLGNTEPGDGSRYRGRGLIQITGRANYTKCGAALGANFVESPESLETIENACRSAAWFWSTRGCNELADAGDFERITRRINGGLNGFTDRLGYYARAKNELGVA